MPPLLTLVARRSDGLPLVATQTPQPNMNISSKQQQEAKDILRSTTHSASKMSVVSGQRIYYYMTRDSLCFLTMTEESYPKRMAFSYLDEVADVVLGELVKEFANEWRGKVDQAARPFCFIHYDPLIQRKQRDYRDARDSQQHKQSNSRLNEDLNEIQSIMRKNIDEILNRGDKLDHVANISSELQAKSKDFKWGAKKLTWQARLQQYGPMAAIALIIILVLYVKFFW